MASLIEVVSNFLKPYKFFVILVILLVIFSLIGYYTFKQYSSQMKKSQLSNFANTNQKVDSIEVIMFHVDWCPHCKKALPDWKSFSSEYNGKIVNGYQVNVNPDGTNCTDDNDPRIAEMIKQYKIESYPTVIIMKDGERYDFDAKITKYALDQFVQSVCSSNR